MDERHSVPISSRHDGRIWALVVGHLEKSFGFIDGGICGPLRKEVRRKISRVWPTNTLYPNVRDSKLHGLYEDWPNRDSLTELDFDHMVYGTAVTNKITRLCAATCIDQNGCGTIGGITILKIITIEKVSGF